MLPLFDQKTYTFDDVYNATLEYFDGDELAAKVWSTKYALKDSAGNIFWENSNRYAPQNSLGVSDEEVPQSPYRATRYSLSSTTSYIVPQSSPMTGIGNNFKIASLSNCFVVGLDGSLPIAMVLYLR